jgi:steroid delta-isomerase-like uncharacterized protein
MPSEQASPRSDGFRQLQFHQRFAANLNETPTETGPIVAHGENHEYTLEEDMAAAKEERKALPDMKVKVNQFLAERDLVAVYWTASGTNTQAGMGFPATGKKIKIDGMTIFRFKAGKICEEWSVWDMLSVMRQAGLLPPPPPQ